MFFFGLFSTHLPYILVGLIYLATFGFASLKAMKAGALEEQQQEKSEEIRVQPSNLGLTDVFFYEGASDSIAEVTEPATRHALLTVVDIKLRDHSGPHISAFSTFGLFVRPPPVLA